MSVAPFAALVRSICSHSFSFRHFFRRCLELRNLASLPSYSKNSLKGNTSPRDEEQATRGAGPALYAAGARACVVVHCRVVT